MGFHHQREILGLIANPKRAAEPSDLALGFPVRAQKGPMTVAPDDGIAVAWQESRLTGGTY